MGINYKAAIVVGLQQCDLEFDELEEHLDDGTLRRCPPYYDGSDADDAVVGFIYRQSGAYCSGEIEWDQAQIDKLKADFKAITGQDAKVFLTPVGI